MRSLPLFARQMLFLALLYNTFHIIVSFLPNIRNSTCLHTVHQNHYPEDIFLLTLTTFQVPDAETSSCRLQMGPITPRQDFFLIHPTHSCNRNEVIYFLPASRGWQMIFFSHLSCEALVLLWLTDFIRFGFSFLYHLL